MRRQRVAIRAKVRNHRARQRAAVVAVLALGCLAFLVARRMKNEIALSTMSARLLPAASSVVGAPEPLVPQFEAFFKGGGASLSSAERGPALLARFPCLESVRLRRDWLRRSAHYEVSLRTPIATLQTAGRPSGYLSDEGVAFTAPAGLFDVAAPLVVPGSASAEELKRLAAFLPLAEKPDELLSPLARMNFVSAQDGWEATLADGTTLLWGSLNWTPEKFERLREVILDARARDGEQKVKTMAADLRYFEDGKILLRPLAARMAGTR